jgi:hypothetical protein
LFLSFILLIPSHNSVFLDFRVYEEASNIFQLVISVNRFASSCTVGKSGL